MAIPISRGKIQKAQKVVVFGPEGIGKSTFLSQFPEPLFIDTEGSTYHMDVPRYPKPSSWSMLLEEVQQVKNTPGCCKTLAIDTMDWAEQLCVETVCAKAKKDGIEDFGYGKGYVYVAEEFGRLLNLLEEVNSLGIHIVIAAHAKMRKFEQPDEMGSYDRWEMKLSKNVAPLLKEWADAVLFANYKTYAVSTDKDGKKFKAQGGSRVIHTTHHPCWDAKNRWGLADELPFIYDSIAAHISTPSGVPAFVPQPVAPVKKLPEATPPIASPPAPAPEAEQLAMVAPVANLAEPTPPLTEPEIPDDIPTALRDLMVQSNVSGCEVQRAVAGKGYYPSDTPIANYDPQFVQGVLIAAWPKVYNMILEDRKDLPF